MKTSKKPIYIILGTRAQFIKMAPIMAEMGKRNLSYTLIYTAQHRENVVLSVFDKKLMYDFVDNYKDCKRGALFSKIHPSGRVVVLNLV
ncbi:UDP-N-acetyl glucosamine 2-epimerase [Candidatus Dojkabacteria bacterium]|uniref:UDP-N-acetyl glucosamine 2-epimerase n=1 Tax=Candidatus Dojkabacteria bacterium TaxID=2099670 RepID=A0A847D0L5_9BACT|nr:UDP-N-acetyl glucosamine 2-epimerase [Candidatus Dojkabacteria bacterium]